MALEYSNVPSHTEGSFSPELHSSPLDITTSHPCLTDCEPTTLNKIETQTRELAENLDQLLHSVHSALYRMSGLTMDCVSVFANSVESTCDSVDASIKNTYSLMAKCEELSKSMTQLAPIGKEISNVKCTLDKFEEMIKNTYNF